MPTLIEEITRGNATEKVASFISQTRYEDIPKEAIEAAKRGIIDYLGVALAGLNDTAVKILTAFVKELEAKEEAIIIRGKFKTSAFMAALVNGAMANALEYDDTVPLSEGYNCHPSVPILPAVFALAEKYQLSGKDVLRAYIIGFEVESRIGSVIGKYAREIGWHPTSVLGNMGAASASANLLKLNVPETQMALGIAGSLAGGLMENIGTMAKPLHAGNAARNGVIAGLLAQRGFTAAESILGGRFGFCSVFSGMQISNLTKLEQGLGSNWAIVTPGISFKVYPSARVSHSAIEAMLYLRKRHRFDPEEVSEITCKTNPSTLKFLKYHQPKTASEAMFSLEYILAVALVDGKVSLEQFDERKILDPAVQALIPKIKYICPEKWHSGSERLAQEVTVKLQDGTEHSYKVVIPKGEPQNPVDDIELANKFRHCTRLALNSTDTERMMELIFKLDSLDNINPLIGMVSS